MNYQDKASDYYAGIRHDLIRLIDPNSKHLRVLEIGAGYGTTLYFLKVNNIAVEAVGVDIFEDKSNPNNYKPIDRLIFGDITEVDLSEYLSYFDLILLADVLEHITEPKPVLQKLQMYLKDSGKIIVSMPNIRHYSAIKKIVFQGDFRYEESGIFDYTHVRFYCRKNIVELLTDSGLTILKEESSITNYKGRSYAKLLNKATFRLFEEFFSYQYFYLAEKSL
ncbi:class I SAM-dependent methyltransferase [Flavobacterium aurantiibacter]|uniref:Uncharacterized protein n=1 Tax=Flavobacterium aurantiibacter TaxID=2023067 RepID=A0A255ZJ24_9FLAO|nr:class I SAM-dependent methyltransferase [Flavobacterium aurantiibacter]OYQ41557.1 hypothetical protein CHX27_12865 [Flavobacterium aurantiibacter]